jgi:hypothetical protein
MLKFIDPDDSLNSNSLMEDIISSEFVGTNSVNLLDLETIMTHKFPSLYCLKYKPIRKRPITFESKFDPHRHRPWQVQILDDSHPNKAVMKSRQLGLSEVGVSEAIWFLDVHSGTKCMYTFPRDQQMKDFSNTRIAPVFEESEYLGTLEGSIRNLALKQIGDSYLFMRSAWGSALGEGVDIDHLNFDEYDRMRDNVELAFMEGLKSSKYGWIRRWSTPSIPGRGIHRVFEDSDQMRYVWTCEHCGERQFLTFEENIIQVKDVNTMMEYIEDGSYIIGCKKCKKELNRWNKGIWVPQYPSKIDTRGYRISQMDAVWISADDIMRRQFKYPSVQLFMNYVVGEPYVTMGMVITDSDIISSITLPKEIMSRNHDYSRIVVGIDWGKINWMLILGLKSTGEMDLLNIYWATDNPLKPLEPVNYFAAILGAYKPDVIVADSGYGADRNAFLYAKYPNALWSCYWMTIKNPEQKVRFKPIWTASTHEVTVDKTVYIQKTLHKVKNNQIGMFTMNEKLVLLTKHLKNIRIMDMEDSGVLYQQATRVGPDHLGCALAYALIGIDKLTNMGATSSTSSFEYDFV